jgi:soluble lytic murein transglycosylase-like protein
MRWLILLSLLGAGVMVRMDIPTLPECPQFTTLIDHPAKVSNNPAELRALAEVAAIMHDLPPEIFIAQVETESGFRVDAISPAGAQGIAQMMPGTAKAWHVDPRDPIAALDAMAAKMAEYWQTYRNQGHDKQTAYKLALAAYNAGTGAVAKHGKVPPYDETQKYVARIMVHWPEQS